MGARRKGRELALQMLYQWDVTKAPIDELVEATSALQAAGDDARAFARFLAEGTIRRADDLDAAIARQSEGWRIDRMPTVDRNILRLAVYELLETETPASVVINEAIEVAKRFSAPDAVSFINGVLDAIWHSIEKASESR